MSIAHREGNGGLPWAEREREREDLIRVNSEPNYAYCGLGQ